MEPPGWLESRLGLLSHGSKMTRVDGDKMIGDGTMVEVAGIGTGMEVAGMGTNRE